MARNLKAQIDIVADTKGVTAGVKRTENAFTSLSRKLGIAGLSIGGAIATASKAVDLLRTSLRKAGQERALELQLKRTGVELEDFISTLNTAAEGTISRATLINQSATAIALGVPVERLQQILEIARTGAVATGQTVEFAFESLTIGLARQSKLLLDNVGILVDVEKAQKKYADEIGVTVENLTEAQKRQIFLNDALEQGVNKFDDLGEAISTTTIAVDRAAAAVDNLVTSLGKEVSEAQIVGNVANTLTLALTGNEKALAELERNFLGATGEGNKFVRSLKLVGVILARNPFLPGVTNLIDNLAELRAAEVAANEEQAKVEDAAKKAGDALGFEANIWKALADAAKEGAKEIADAREKEDESTESTEANTEALKANNEQRQIRIDLLGREAGAAKLTTVEFDKLVKTMGQAAAVSAAVASGVGSFGGRLTGFFGGGSRFINQAGSAGVFSNSSNQSSIVVGQSGVRLRTGRP